MTAPQNIREFIIETAIACNYDAEKAKIVCDTILLSVDRDCRGPIEKTTMRIFINNYFHSCIGDTRDTIIEVSMDYALLKNNEEANKIVRNMMGVKVNKIGAQYYLDPYQAAPITNWIKILYQLLMNSLTKREETRSAEMEKEFFEKKQTNTFLTP